MMEQVLPLLPQTESEVTTVVKRSDADPAHDTADRLHKPTLAIGCEQDLVAPLCQHRKVTELVPGATSSP